MDKKRCALGERKDPKTGKCEKMSEELIKYRQSLRNKKKGVVFDENNNKVKPMKRVTAKKKPIRLIAINEDEITEEKIQKSIDRTISEDIEPSPEEEKEKEIQTREQESIDSDRTISEDIQPSPEEKEQEQQEQQEKKKSKNKQKKRKQKKNKKK